jgi:hypothetical protein
MESSLTGYKTIIPSPAGDSVLLLGPVTRLVSSSPEKTGPLARNCRGTLLTQLTDSSKGELSFPWNLLLYGYKTIIPSPAGDSVLLWVRSQDWFLSSPEKTGPLA